MTQKILYIDMDGVIVDFESAFDKLDTETRTKCKGNEDQVPGLFGLMDPIPGAIEAVTELTTLFDTYVLSTVPWGNTSGASQKIEWIQRHFGKEKSTPLWKRVILSHHKHLNKGDFLIDDRRHNGAAEFPDHNPGGEWIHFGSEAFPDWPTVVAYLRERAH
jgi:5'-nucleotidase